jgi:3-oxoacyl-[acyl-carrier-protein] synthase-3
MTPEDLDLIILATDTPDFVTPPTSPIIQHKLGAKNAGAFDINSACCDAVIGMSIAAQHIMTDPDINNALVIGGYGMTKWLDWTVPVLPLLFSDGAGAVILSKSDEPGYLASTLFCDGSYWDCYGIYLGTGCPPTGEMIEKKEHALRFHPSGHRYPPDVNPTHWADLIGKVVKKAGHSIEDLDMVLLTQVRLEDIKDTMKRLGLPLEKTHWIMNKFGYTGSACVIMALYDALQQGKINRGDLVSFCASGAGMTMSAAVYKWL